MSDRNNKGELIKRVATKTGQDKATVAEIVDTTIEEIYQAFKRKKRSLFVILAPSYPLQK